MSDDLSVDPDLPSRAGLVGRLHAKFGRVVIAASARLRRPVSIGVRLLALNARGEILLVRHSYLPGLMLPGGGVDPGETSRQAAAREVREETGIELVKPPELFHVYLNRALAERDHVVLYVAKDVQQMSPFTPNLEIRAAGFFDPQSLPEDVTPATLARIGEVLQGNAPTDDW